jgi:hypothetical protein
MNNNLITISVSFLDELDPEEARKRVYYQPNDNELNKLNEPGIYRVVKCRGSAPDCDYLGDINTIVISDLDHDSEHFFFERENGVLVVNDSEDCADAQYYRVG